MKVLILGVSGMLGSAVFRKFLSHPEHVVVGTLRSSSLLKHYSEAERRCIRVGVDVVDEMSLIRVFEDVKPDLVINCVGLIKQLQGADDPINTLPINSILPHRLLALCNISGARLIHISTDCVFSGSKGAYTESDISDAIDLYGKSKFIGELAHSKNAITLRTSIIGHGLQPNSSLVDWFLSQGDDVFGYTKAIFSGLPTVELASVILNFVVPRPELHGLYHVSANAISKYDLLALIADQYHKKINIVANNDLVIDRSLVSSRFTEATGYQSAGWPELVSLMHTDYLNGR